MNESILLDWVNVENELPKSVTKVRWRCKDGKEDVGFFNGEFMTFDPVSINEITHWKYLDESEAIKKWEDSSGKETGMKWVKASERLPDRQYNYHVKIRAFDGGVYNDAAFWNGVRFSQNGAHIFIEVVEWLDESVPPYKEEERNEVQRLKNLVKEGFILLQQQWKKPLGEIDKDWEKFKQQNNL